MIIQLHLSDAGRYKTRGVWCKVKRFGGRLQEARGIYLSEEVS